MKKLILFSLLIVSGLAAYGQQTDAQNTTQFNIIRNETAPGGNTKGRIADAYEALNQSKMSRAERITAGSTDTYTATLLNPTTFDYTKNPLVVVTFTNANTITTPSLNPSSKGAKTLVKNDGTALVAGDIKVGSTHWLYYDGTNFRVMTLGGGGDALTSNPLSQFASTTSAQLRGVLSDETGTGAAVYATSPTFVTPLLGTPTSGVATNITGLPLSTGVTGTLPVANGGTGTTTPSIVAGTNVTVSGTWPNQTINASGGGGGGWATTGTTTMTGVATIASNATRQHIFNGTWTAAANYDYHLNFAGSFTGRASQTNDLLWGYKFQPTLTRGSSSANQTLTAVLIKPIFTGSGDLNNYALTTLDGKVLFKNGGKYAPSIGAGLEIMDSTHNANGADVDLYAPLATTVNDRIYELHGYIDNSSGTKTQMTAIYAENVSNTAGAEGGRQKMNITTAGALVEYFRADPDGAGGVNLALVSTGAMSGKRVMFNSIDYSLKLGQDPGSTAFFSSSNNPASQMLGGMANYSTSASSFAEWTIGTNQAIDRSDGLGLLAMPAAFPTFNAFRPAGTALFSGSNKSGGLAIVMASSSGNIRWYVGGETSSELRGTITASGNFGWGQNTPTALFHLGAGTATAGTAPFKFTTGGTELGTPENGVVEPATGDANIKFTASGVKYILAKTLTNTATLNFGSTAAGAATDLTITVTGAADGDPVSLGVPNASTLSDGAFSAWVSSANTVTVRFANNNLVTALDPASGTFRVSVTHY